MSCLCREKQFTILIRTNPHSSSLILLHLPSLLPVVAVNQIHSVRQISFQTSNECSLRRIVMFLIAGPRCVAQLQVQVQVQLLKGMMEAIPIAATHTVSGIQRDTATASTRGWVGARSAARVHPSVSPIGTVQGSTMTDWSSSNQTTNPWEWAYGKEILQEDRNRICSRIDFSWEINFPLLNRVASECFHATSSHVIEFSHIYLLESREKEGQRERSRSVSSCSEVR